MIDLMFSDSVKAAMTIAKISPLERLESLWLELDIGDISTLPGLSCRESVMRSVWARPEGVEDEACFNALWQIHYSAISRIVEASHCDEPVRIWWSDAPGEACGFCFAVSLLENAASRITGVKLPSYFDEGESICVHDSLSSVPPGLLSRMLPLEQEISPALRRAISYRWRKLVSENAPLRAMVNGRLISIPANFYDHALRRQLPGNEFFVAYAIGKTMGETQLGVRGWWYARRIRAMIETGELIIVKSNPDFYQTLIIKSTGGNP